MAWTPPPGLREVPELLGPRLELDARGAGLRELGVQFLQLLHHEALALLEGDDAVFLVVAMEGALRFVELLAGRRGLLGQPVPRLLRGVELLHDVLLDVERGEGVRHERGEFRVVGLHPHVHETGVAERLDGDP